MNKPDECLHRPAPLVQPIVRQLATLAFPHVTLTGDELTALDAAVQTGVDAPYDLARVLNGRANWRTGRVLAPEACRVLQRLERRNGNAAPANTCSSRGSPTSSERRSIHSNVVARRLSAVAVHGAAHGMVGSTCRFQKRSA